MINQVNQSLIHQIEITLNTSVKSISYIPSGITNDNYLVNNEFIIKIKDQRVNYGNDIPSEIKVSKLANEAGLSPAHYFFPEFIKVDFIDNTSYLSIDNYQQHLSLLVQAIKTLHRFNVKNITSFNMFDRLKFYKQKSGILTFLPNEEIIIELAKNDYDKANKTLCHNDLVNGNILIQKQKLFLIDFEYAGINDPDFDVVSFLSENAFVDESVKEAFLQTYYQNEIIPTTKLDHYFRFADLLWYYWGLYAFQQTKKSDFHGNRFD